MKKRDLKKIVKEVLQELEFVPGGVEREGPNEFTDIIKAPKGMPKRQDKPNVKDLNKEKVNTTKGTKSKPLNEKSEPNYVKLSTLDGHTCGAPKFDPESKCNGCKSIEKLRQLGSKSKPLDELKKLIKEVLMEDDEQREVKIGQEILKNLGLFDTKPNTSRIQIQKLADELIAMHSSQPDNTGQMELPLNEEMTKNVFVDFANGIRGMRNRIKQTTNKTIDPLRMIDSFENVCIAIFKRSNPRFDEAIFRAACV